MKAIPLAKTASVTAVAESATCVESAYKAAREEQVAQTFQRPLGLDDSPDAASRESVRGKVCRSEVRRRSSPFWAAGGHRSRWSNIMTRARVCLKRGVVVSAACVVGVCGMVGGVRADYAEIVARYGTPVPGIAGATYASLLTQAPLMTRDGRIAFVAKFSGTGVTSANNTGLMLDGDGPAETAIRAGSGLSTLAGASVSAIGSVQLTGDDAFAFSATLSGTGVTSSNDSTWWVVPGTAPVLAYRESVSSYGAVTDLVDLPSPVSAVATFRRGSTPTANIFAYWQTAWQQGQLNETRVAGTGDPVPRGTGVHDSTLRRLANSGGLSLIYSGITGSGIAVGTQGLWCGRPGSWIEIARSGVSIGGTTFSNLFGTGSHPALNDAGTIVFTATTSAGRQGLWRSTEGARTPQPVVQSGDAAPEAGSGVSFASMVTTLASQNVLVNSPAAGAESIIAATSLQGAGVHAMNSRSLWQFRGGTRSLLLRGGEPLAPGLESLTIDNASVGVNMNPALGASNVVVNGAGTVAVRIPYVGSGDAYDCALFRFQAGQRSLLAKEGDSFVFNGDRFTIHNLRRSSGLQLNERGQVLLVGEVSSEGSDWLVESAWLLFDEYGSIHIVAKGGLVVPLANGQTLRMSVVAAMASNNLSDSGEVVVGCTVNGSADHAVVRYTVVPTEQRFCPGDHNRSGLTSVEDLWSFLEDFAVGNSAADVNQDAQVELGDLFQFLDDWFRCL